MRFLPALAAVTVLSACGGGAASDASNGPPTGDASVADVADVAAMDEPIFGDTQPKGPPYPIVFAHGFFGFEDFAGAGFVNYFYKVKDTLATKGETVFTPAVDPFNSSEYRGAQLAIAVQGVLAATGAAKVVIVGHSQGGLDARVVAHDHPDWVAAVVTIGTPHDGVPIADIALKLISDSRVYDVIDAISKVVGTALYDKVGNETSMSKALRQFTSDAMKAFNAKYTDAFGVKYFSIAGRTASKGDDESPCKTDAMPDFMKVWRGDDDPVDPLLSLTEAVLESYDGNVNDGLVRAKDAHWGTFLGCIPADHLDEMGQLFGDSPGPGNHFDHLAFYTGLVSWLRTKGF